ncbi:MAG: hypothetical protein HRU38_08420 [Saccharospirillaceae bacterium]|nr:hypothetical protein [Pseudomonadales bacterium]NRB78678.1 hypothetical protein [Saccharospirillaceae bacterium]
MKHKIKVRLIGICTLIAIFSLFLGNNLPTLVTESSLWLRLYIVIPFIILVMLYFSFIYNPKGEGTGYQQAREGRPNRKLKILYTPIGGFFCVVIMGGAIGYYSFGWSSVLTQIGAFQPWVATYKIKYAVEGGGGTATRRLPPEIKLYNLEDENSEWNDYYHLPSWRLDDNEFKKGNLICLKGRSWFFGTKITDEFEIFSKLANQLYCNKQRLFNSETFYTKLIKVNDIDTVFLMLMSNDSELSSFSLILDNHFVTEFKKVEGRIEMSYANSSLSQSKYHEFITQWVEDKELKGKTETRQGLNFLSVSIPENVPNFQQEDGNGGMVEYDSDIYLLFIFKSLLTKVGGLGSNDRIESYTFEH